MSNNNHMTNLIKKSNDLDDICPVCEISLLDHNSQQIIQCALLEIDKIRTRCD